MEHYNAICLNAKPKQRPEKKVTATQREKKKIKDSFKESRLNKEFQTKILFRTLLTYRNRFIPKRAPFSPI